MSDFSPYFLEQIGYENFTEERKLAFKKQLRELGYVIGQPKMERVADYRLRGNSRETLDALYGE